MPDANTHIVIPIYDDVTQLDFTGPHQVFSRVPGVRITVASPGGQSVKADGLVFADLADLADVDSCDLLCVPGGYGSMAAMVDESFIREIRRLAGSARYLTSVCTGSLILAAAGLLHGRRAGCHWAWRDLLTPFGVIVDESRVVRDGNIITGGGVTAGIDFALVVAAEIADQSTAEAVQLALEYAPAPPFNAGRPELAPPELVAGVRSRLEASLPARRAAVVEALHRLQPTHGAGVA